MWRPAHLSSGAAQDDPVPMSASAGRLGALVIVAVGLACVLPSVASATDYCVGVNTSCAPANHRDKLEEALAAASMTPVADRILLGAEKYTAPSTAGFTYSSPASPVEIVGAGVGKSILTATGGADGILEISGANGSSVSDMTFSGPPNESFGFEGLSTNGVARHVEVIEDSAQISTYRIGVYLGDGGTLEDSSVKLDPSKGTVGVFIGDGHVLRSSLTALTGAKSNNGTIERSRLFAGELGVEAYDGVTSVSSTRIDVAEGDGLHAEAYSGIPTSSVTADGVTLVSHSPGVAAAVASTKPDAGFGAAVNLKNSVLRGFSQGLQAEATGAGKASVTIAYSDYDPSGNSTSGGANAKIEAANVSNVGDAGFVNAAAGDYHLRAGSRLIDAGAPGTAQGLDLDGHPLVTDGNGDGVARRDIGAFEASAVPPVSQPSPADAQPPLITGFRATPALFAIGRALTPRAARRHHGTRFRYVLSEQARVSLKIQRRLRGRHARYRTVATLTRSGRAGVNRIRFTGRIGKRALRAGRYRARITATDAAGNRSAPRATRFRIAR